MMKLNDREWKEFYFKDLFEIKKGFYNKKPPSENTNGGIPFIGATDNNNGVTEFYTLENIDIHSKTGDKKNVELEKKIFSAKSICVTNNGSVGYAYYQANKFTCSHDVNPLYLKKDTLSRPLAFFLISSIEKQKVCFQYSRKWRPKRMVKSKMLLPVNKINEPDYQFMEDYSKSIFEKKEKKYKDYITKVLEKLEYKEIEPLEDKEWGEFFIIDIFDTIQRGKRLTKTNQTKGNIPYISSTASNNGVDNFIGNTQGVRIFENCLTIANSGSVGASFYHPYKFVASDHITHLQKEEMNEYVYLFISTLTNRFSKKYNFNREINDARISREKILLPINEKNEPDYEYMEQYIKNLKYRKIKQYLDFKKSN
jgi:hypothetical protein